MPMQANSIGSNVQASMRLIILSFRPSSPSHLPYTALETAFIFALLSAAPGLASCLNTF